MTHIYKLPAYAAIMLIKDNQIFLVKRRNTDWANNLWSIPGGLLEENETLINAAAREAREELGVEIRTETLQLVHVIHVRKSTTNTKDILGFYFMTNQWFGTAMNNEPHRHSDAAWFSLDSLPEQITEHALQAIDGLKNGKAYSEN